MKHKLSAGVIGIGFIGEEHIEAIRRTNLGEVTAIAGHNIQKTFVKAEKFSVTRYFDDYRQLLSLPDIDVVHICTPNNLHYSMAKEALLAGKHVVCEKPLTMTIAEAHELLELAEEKHLVNAIHFNIRYYPLVRHTKDMIDAQELGRIYSITGSYLQDWLYYDTDYSWRLESSQSGATRAIGDIGTHWMDLIEYVSGEKIVSVMADCSTFLPFRKKPKKALETWSNKLMSSDEYEEVPIDTEDYASVLLRFESGAKGCFTVNQMAAGRKNQVKFDICGSKSALMWNSEAPNELSIGQRSGPNGILIRDPSLMSSYSRSLTSLPGGHNEGFADTSKQLFKEVYQYILDGNFSAVPTFPTFLHGLREAQLCEAIVKSSRMGCWIDVDNL